MVYSAGSRDKQGAERAAWVPAMSHVLIRMLVMRIGSVGRNSLICTLMICELFNKYIILH